MSADDKLMPDWMIPTALRMKERDFRKNRVAAGLEEPYIRGLCLYEDLVDLASDKKLLNCIKSGIHPKDIELAKNKIQKTGVDNSVLVFRKAFHIVDGRGETDRQTTSYEHLMSTASQGVKPWLKPVMLKLTRNTLSLPMFKESNKINVEQFVSTVFVPVIDFSIKVMLKK